MITAMNHVSFTVKDLNKSIAFYKKVLRFECVSIAERDEKFSSAVSGLGGVAMKIAYMNGPGCAIELIQYIKGSGTQLDTRTNNIGSTHVCFNVSDFDEWIKHMEDYKVRHRGEICIVPAGPNKGKKVCYMTDDDGNNIEFIEDTGKQLC